MRYACSYCHTIFEAEPDAEHKACPTCKAEAGLEPVKTGAPNAMRYFGLVLLVIAVLAVGGVVVGVLS